MTAVDEAPAGVRPSATVLEVIDLVKHFPVRGSGLLGRAVAQVQAVSGVSFTVDVEDFGEPGSADTFRIVLGDGYTAGGVLLKGNIQVRDA